MRPDVTTLLHRARENDADALDQVLPLLYDELRALARSQRAQRGSGETLNTTALVHEAYERMARSESRIADRKHFFRLAARVMRSVLVDHARAQQALKRGGDRPPPAEIDEERVAARPLVPHDRVAETLALDDALTRLAALDERQARVVELRYFVGLSIPETAEVMDLSPATVKRAWTVARAWLHREMTRGE